ncbi:MAG: SRPBCC family protein [Dermatophilaceae bacterium]
MELTHRFTVPAPVDRAWATFTDLELVGGCFPGATVTSVDESGFAGTVKVKLGPIALQYSGTGSFVERDDEAHRAVLEAKGKDRRGNGTAGATVRIALDPEGDGTAVDVTTDLAVTGKPAQFGRGVMQDVSDKLLQQFVACIEGTFAEPDQRADDAAAPPADTAPAPATPPSATSPPASATPSAAARAAPTSAARTADDGALDLGSTVLPVLARTYGGYLAAGVAGLVIGWLIGRRGG